MASSYCIKISALSTGIKSKHDDDFYCLNSLHSFRTGNKLESHKKVYENKIFCNIVMPSEGIKILEFNKYEKSDKVPFIICTNHECLIGKIDRCKNNPENSSTIKVGERIPSGFSMSTISLFKSIENKYDVYKGENWMKIFCKSLSEQAIKIINFRKKKIKLLTK